jgi:HK97 family phage portal protein
LRAFTDVVPSVEFVAQEWNTEEQAWVRNRNHAVEERFDDPNPYQSQNDLISTNITDLICSGNALTNIMDSDKATKDKPNTLRLEALHADFVKPVVDEIDVFAGYSVQRQGWLLVGQPEKGDLVSISDMVHARLPNPNDPLWGLSPLQVGANVLDAEALAIAWNRGLVENSAKFSSVFTSKLELSAEQHAELSDILIDAYTGLNAGRPMILSHGLEVQKMAGDPVEMDFVNSAFLEATRTCAILRCPPPVIGISKDATLANLTEYYRQFWTTGVIPQLKMLMGAYNRSWVWPRWGRGVRIWFDLSEVEALKENYEDKVKMATALVALGYTLNEANRRVGLGMPDVMTGDIRYAVEGLIPILDEARRDASITVRVEDDESPPVALLDEGEKSAPVSELGKKAFWAKAEKDRKRYYTLAEKAAAKLISDDLKVAVRSLREGHVTAVGGVTKNREEAWESFLASTWRDTGDAFFQRQNRLFETGKGRAKRKTVEPDSTVYTLIGANGEEYPISPSPEEKSLEFKAAGFWTPEVRNHLQDAFKAKVRSITRTTREWIAGLASISGATGPALATQVESLSSNYSKQRARVIAQVEVVGASEYGAYEAAVRSGFKIQKEWISQRDHRVRDSHVDVDGEVRDLEDAFSNSLQFPCDPTGPLHETSGCRCALTYSVALTR